MQELAVFFNTLDATPSARASSRLLTTADRDLGALLRYATPEEVERVVALLGPIKGKRIREEIQRMKHIRLPPETISRIARHLAEHLEGERPLGPASRYFKPIT